MQDVVVVVVCEYGMCLFGLNVLGVFNSNFGYYVFFFISLECGVLLFGWVGIVIQFGVYGVYLFGMVCQCCLGIFICVVIGNEVDVILGDSIGWLVELLEIDVVMVYVEFICNVDSFFVVLEVVYCVGKLVILYKVGCSVLGSCVVLFYIVLLVGDDKVLDVVLGDYVVICVRIIEELMDIVYFVIWCIYLVGNSFGMIIVSGGVGIIVSDVVEEVGLLMLLMLDMVQEWLKVWLFFVLLINLVDCIVQVLNDLMLVCDFIELMVVDGGYCLLFVFFIQVGIVVFIGVCLVEQFWWIKEVYFECLFVVLVMGEGEELVFYEEVGFVLFEDFIWVVVVIQVMGWFGEVFVWLLCLCWFVGGLQLFVFMFGEVEVKCLLVCVGIEFVVEVVLGSVEEVVVFVEGIGYLVVLKFVLVDIQYKLEIGGVLFGVSDVDVVCVGF